MKFKLDKILRTLLLSILVFGSGIFIFKSCSSCDFKFFKLFNTTKISSKILVSEKNLPEFNSAEISTVSEDIQFIDSDSYGLEICAFEEYGTPIWSVEGKKLKVKLKEVRNGTSYEASGKEYIKVYCPKSEFENISVKSTSGNIGVNFNTCENINLSSTSGNIIVEGNILKSTKAQSTSGNIEVFGDLNSVSNFCTTSGNIIVKGNILENVDVKSVSGDVEFSGDLKGVSNFRTTSGDVKINCNDVISDYVYNLYTVSGRIKVNGEKFECSVKSFIEKNSNKIEAETVTGDINLEFQN